MFKVRLCQFFDGNSSFVCFVWLHRAASEPVQRAFVSELAPEKYRASVLGACQLVVGLFALPASLIAGILWTSFGMHLPFYFSFILTCLAALLLLFVREKRHRQLGK